jgi:Tfp pilus assembly protein PilZ
MKPDRSTPPWLHDEHELLALFPDLTLQPRPLLINIYLPPICNGVLFIENQDSYTLAFWGGIDQELLG